MTDHIFISYARKDSETFARQLHDDLQIRGITPWLDVNRLKPGDDWNKEIDAAIETARALVVVLSPNAIESVQVGSEWNYAVNLKIPIIPLIYIDCKVPRVLLMFNYLDFRDKTQYKDRLNQLIAELERPGTSTSLDAGIAVERERQAEESERRREQARRRVVGQRPAIAVDHFHGRVHELAELGQLVSDSGVRIASIIGRGGMGKTALACKVLFALEADTLPTGETVKVDGIAYFSTNTGGINLERMFLDCAEMLGGEHERLLTEVWKSAEMDASEKVDRLLEALNNGRYVILLDNMEDLIDEQGQIANTDFRTFFEMSLTVPHRAFLLLTSRVPVAFPQGMTSLDVRVTLTEGLSVDDGVAMLRDLDPNGSASLRDADSVQLARVVERTHGVPRALEVFGGIMHDDMFATLDSAIDAFFQYDITVEQLITDAYKRFDDDAKQVMTALSVFRRPVPIVAVQFLLGETLAAADVQRILLHLVRVHVVTIVDRVSKLVGMHPVDRDYAYNSLPDDQKQALNRRAASYYQQLRTAEDSWKSIDDLQPQLNEFDHLIAAGDYDDAARVVDSIDEKYLAVWGHYRRLHNLREQVDGKISDGILLATNTHRLGTMTHIFAMYARALEYFEKALTLSRENHYSEGEISSLQGIGYCYRRLNQTATGRPYIEEALALARQLKFSEKEADCLNALGNSYLVSHYELALENYEASLKINRELGRLSEQSIILSNMGEIYVKRNDFETATRLFEECIATAKSANNKRWQGFGLGNLSAYYLRVGDLERGIEVANEALNIARETGEKRLIASRSRRVSTIYALMGDYRTAIEYATTGLDDSAAIDERRRGFALATLIQIYVISGAAQQVVETALEGVQNAIDVQYRRGQRERGAYLAQGYLYLGKLQEAQNAITQAMTVDVTYREIAHTSMIAGIVMLRTNQNDSARAYFIETIEKSEYVLSEIPQFFAAKYTRALALAGLALLSDGDIQADYLQQAETAYRAALENCNAKGVVEDALRLLDELRKEDATRILDSVRAILTDAI